MDFIKQLFNIVPEALTFNNPRQGTQSGDTKMPSLPSPEMRAEGTPQHN